MQLNSNQIDILAKYFSDLSKIIFASAVLGFFIPISETIPTFQTFLFGSATTIAALILSIRLAK